MPQSISKDIVRICKVCGEKFHPKARKQYCCNRDKVGRCVVCDNEFIKKCTTSDTKVTCSKKCQAKLIADRRKESAQSLVKTCKWCGKEFHPKSMRDAYCYDTHYKICEVCGKKFIIDVRKDPTVKTCSDECRYKLALKNRDIELEKEHQKQTVRERYGVDNIMQADGIVDKLVETNRERYGCDWYTQTDEYKAQIKETSLERYGVDHHLKSSEVISKRKETCKAKYGSSNFLSSAIGMRVAKDTMVAKYGVENASQLPEFKRKATASSRISKLEQRVSALLSEYNIEFIHHYILKDKTYSHEFDFYIPKYKILVDCDGLYFHGYLDDPNGKQVIDYYDETRLALIPKDHIFHVIVEGQEDKDVKYLADMIEKLDKNVFDYEGELFKWCRSIDFPYPSYAKDRMIKDYSSLCKYESDIYKPTARLGISSINHFHKSLYDARVGHYMSPKEAWYDDNLLKKVIKNRLIYKNDVDPSKILRGFNISKTCPRVSLFNPVLAKYLIEKYLGEFHEIFDPFSGFSGRLLGAASLGKKYIGHDLNGKAVNESNEIINMLSLSKCSVTVADVLTDSGGEYECLLTCPPYSDKEIYANESVFKSCDEWIDLILDKYKCNRYVFVVDVTDKYKNFVLENISTNSHFNKVIENVIVVDKEV